MKPKPLKNILRDMDVVNPPGNPEIEIKGLAYDSRQVQSGCAFFAIPGLKADGHSFIQDAFDNGAAVVILEKQVDVPEAMQCVRVVDSRKALALAAHNFYERPSGKLFLIGVTGTDGKTTTCRLIHSILSRRGEAGLMGTVGHYVAGKSLRASRTTPEAVEINRMLAELVEGGAYAAVMEVSSHALALRRTDYLDFDMAVMTNISQDHLDFHQDMDDYFNVKARLFAEMKAGGKAVINLDDPWGARMAEIASCETAMYSLKDNSADIFGEITSSSLKGLAMKIRLWGSELEVESKLIGAPNAENILAAAAAAAGADCSEEDIAQGIAAFEGVRGRFEYIDGGGFGTIVDYAHTPQALSNLLQTICPFTRGKLRVVFGCGGNRDRAKRPLMGAAAEREADVVYITTDNPRYEEPEAVIGDIAAGLKKAGGARIVPDRRDAIFTALKEAEAGDIVVIAGKGHEDYQEIKGEFIPFDDRETVREWLSENHHSMDSLRESSHPEE